MKNENSLRLKHILDAIKSIENYLHDVTEIEFNQEPMRYDAVVRQLEIIGEAATYLSAELREEHPNIPWQKIVGTRNRLIHGYTKISLKIVWEIAKNDLPMMKTQIEEILKA